MIDKSIRQYYDSGMLVKKRADNKRPGYAGEFIKFNRITGKKMTAEDVRTEKAFEDLVRTKGYSSDKATDKEKELHDEFMEATGLDRTSPMKISSKDELRTRSIDGKVSEFYNRRASFEDLDTGDITRLSSVETPTFSTERMMNPQGIWEDGRFIKGLSAPQSWGVQSGNLDRYDSSKGGGGGGGGGGFEEGIETIIEDPNIKTSLVAEDKKSLRDPDRRSLMDRFAEWYLGKKIPGGIKTVKQFKNLLTGKQDISETLKSSLAPEGFKASPTNAFRAFNLARKTGIPVGKILSSPLLPIVGITGIAALANKYRKQITGYDTQREYDEARELRILETRRADMLQRKEEGRDYSDRNLGQVTREIAKKKGLDINNPNEMRNIDKDIEDIKIEQIITGVVKPGEDIDTSKDRDIIPSDINILKKEIGMPEHLTYTPPPEPVSTGGGGGGPPSVISRPSAPAPSAPTGTGGPPSQGGGGGGPPSRGGGSPSRGSPSQSSRGGGNPWGRAYGGRIKFIRGGRIDKPLTGRSRDI